MNNGDKKKYTEGEVAMIVFCTLLGAVIIFSIGLGLGLRLGGVS